MFTATYGRLPTEFTPEMAMGLAQNIPTIEARQALTLARAIGVAFGGGEQLEELLRVATGDAELAFRARMKAEHQKAVGA